MKGADPPRTPQRKPRGGKKAQPEEEKPAPVPIVYEKFKPIESVHRVKHTQAEEGDNPPALTYRMLHSGVGLIRATLEQHGFHDCHDDQFNILWCGQHIKPSIVQGLNEFQKVNHWPRSYELTRKDRLYRNIDKLRMIRGKQHFDFIPLTFCLPADYHEFMMYFEWEQSVKRSARKKTPRDAMPAAKLFPYPSSYTPNTRPRTNQELRRSPGSPGDGPASKPERNPGVVDFGPGVTGERASGPAVNDVSGARFGGKVSSSIPSSMDVATVGSMNGPSGCIYFSNFGLPSNVTTGPWIAKPHASSRGRGIHVFNKLSGLPQGDYVISRYIDNPLLINGFKFDLRLYACVTSFDPLRLYVHEEGLVRFATEPFDNDASFNANKYMHLTNFSINKKSKRFVKNEEAGVDNFGSKWSLGALRRYFAQSGIDDERIFTEIQDIVTKAVIAAEPALTAAANMFIPHRGNCFELYGFDILIDSNLKPWLLETNFSPSLSCDTPLDKRIKSKVVADLMSLIGLTAFDKKKQKETARKKRMNRLALSFRRTETWSESPIQCEEKDLTGTERRILRVSRAENLRSNGFKRIFPLPASHLMLRLFEIKRRSDNFLTLWVYKEATFGRKGDKKMGSASPWARYPADIHLFTTAQAIASTKNIPRLANRTAVSQVYTSLRKTAAEALSEVYLAEARDREKEKEREHVKPKKPNDGPSMYVDLPGQRITRDREKEKRIDEERRRLNRIRRRKGKEEEVRDLDEVLEKGKDLIKAVQQEYEKHRDVGIGGEERFRTPPRPKETRKGDGAAASKGASGLRAMELQRPHSSPGGAAHTPPQKPAVERAGIAVAPGASPPLRLSRDVGARGAKAGAEPAAAAAAARGGSAPIAGQIRPAVDGSVEEVLPAEQKPKQTKRAFSAKRLFNRMFSDKSLPPDDASTPTRRARELARQQALPPAVPGAGDGSATPVARTPKSTAAATRLPNIHSGKYKIVRRVNENVRQQQERPSIADLRNANNEDDVDIKFLRSGSGRKSAPPAIMQDSGDTEAFFRFFSIVSRINPHPQNTAAPTPTTTTAAAQPRTHRSAPGAASPLSASAAGLPHTPVAELPASKSQLAVLADGLTARSGEAAAAATGEVEEAEETRVLKALGSVLKQGLVSAEAVEELLTSLSEEAVGCVIENVTHFDRYVVSCEKTEAVEGRDDPNNQNAKETDTIGEKNTVSPEEEEKDEEEKEKEEKEKDEEEKEKEEKDEEENGPAVRREAIPHLRLGGGPLRANPALALPRDAAAAAAGRGLRRPDSSRARGGGSERRHVRPASARPAARAGSERPPPAMRRPQSAGVRSSKHKQQGTENGGFGVGALKRAGSHWKGELSPYAEPMVAKPVRPASAGLSKRVPQAKPSVSRHLGKELFTSFVDVGIGRGLDSERAPRQRPVVNDQLVLTHEEKAALEREGKSTRVQVARQVPESSPSPHRKKTPRYMAKTKSASIRKKHTRRMYEQT